MTLSAIVVPKVGTLWCHARGGVYKVRAVTNQHADGGHAGDWPVTVVYQNIGDKRIWSRPLSEWLARMKPIELTVHERIQVVTEDDPSKPRDLFVAVERRDFYGFARVGHVVNGNWQMRIVNGYLCAYEYGFDGERTLISKYRIVSAESRSLTTKQFNECMRDPDAVRGGDKRTYQPKEVK